MLNHPVFALFNRRLSIEMRGGAAHLMRLGFLALIFFVILTVQENMRRFAAPGLLVFRGVITVNVLVTCLVGIGIFASCITEEKEAKTLGLLRMSSLSPSAIMLGKATGAMFALALLLIAQLPFAWLCVTLGGVTPRQVLACYAVLLGMLAVLANLGLLLSVYCRSSRSAAVFTGLLVGTAWLSPFVLREFWRIPGWDELSPLRRFWVILSTGEDQVFHSSVCLNLLLGVAFFLLAWWRFRHAGWEQPSSGMLLRNLTRRLTGRKQFLTRAWRFPVAWQAFQLSTGGRFVARLRGYGLLLFVLWICAHAYIYSGSYWHQNYGEWLLIAGLWGLTIESLYRLPRLFGDERSQGTWGSLMMSTLSFGSIVRQKIGGLLAGLSPWLLFFAVGFCWSGELKSFLRNGWHDDEFWGFLLVVCAVLLVVHLSLYSLRAPVVLAAIVLIAFNITGVIILNGWIRIRHEAFILATAHAAIALVLIIAIRRRLLRMAAE
jgi:hypothetical protein